MGEMLAIKLFGTNDVRLVTCEIPKINRGEILIKTSVAAICGTDIRMVKNGRKGVDACHPLTLGHEISGVIEQAETDHGVYKPGMRVTVAPNFGCGTCRMCRRGDHHLCQNYTALGIHLDGCMAEYVRVPAAAVEQGNVIPIPDGISMTEAAVFEPMACVMNGQDRTEVAQGDKVLIIGAGPIGVMQALMAHARGASRIYMNDLCRERLERCERQYPFLTPLYGRDLKAEVAAVSGNKGLDVCITACPVKEVQEQALELMAVNGRVLFFGGLPEDKDFISIHSNTIHYNQLKVTGSTRCSAAHMKRVSEMVRKRELDLSGIVTDIFRAEEYQMAINHVMAAKGIKTALTFE